MNEQPPIEPTKIEISPTHTSPVYKLIQQVGITCDAATTINTIIRPLISLLVCQGYEAEDAFNKSIILIAASAPESQAELMVATQLAITHIVLGRCALLLNENHGQVKAVNCLGNLYIKTSRLGIDQTNTLERMKGKGQQKIIVEKVNIEAGGQAAIGVYEGVGRNDKKGL